MTTERFAVDFIHVPKRMRSHVDGERVSLLADSMAKLGLMTPITVYHGDYTTEDGECLQGPILIAGNHRLQAARELGWPSIECVVSKAGEVERRMWEIAENLHRAELDDIERAEHVAEWEKLRKVSEVSVGGRGRRGGNSETARQLGIDEKEVRNLKKVAEIAPAAKEEARKAGLADNQSALLKVAATPKAQQVQEVQRLAAMKKRPKEPAFSASERRIKTAQDAFLKLSSEERRVFIEWLEENEPAIFDATPAGRAA